ncbi:MAG TPA: phosphoglycolate phosphatase [Nitrospirota bacterium]
MKTFNVDLIIFDLDGTLIDSSGDIAWAANMALSDLGHDKIDSEKVKEGIGWGVRSLLEKIMPGEGAERIEHARIKFLEYYWEHSVVSTCLYPGVMETVKYFNQKNKKMAVVTNKPVKFSEKILSELDLIRYFSIILGGDSVSNRKPHPEPIEKVVAAFEVEKARAVIVGDSPVDCEAGKSAGIAAIGAEYGFRSRKELEDAGCDIIISEISDLKKILS